MPVNKAVYKGINQKKFATFFSCDDDCYKYLASIKWRGKHFKCKGCRYIFYSKGRKPYSRRCNKCGYDESPTANTMFALCRFPLLSAFNIVFKIATNNSGISSLGLSKISGLPQPTCLGFRRKIQRAMEGDCYLLKGNVEVDRFSIGGKNERKRRPCVDNERWVVFALSKTKTFNKAYAMVMESDSASAKDFEPFFKKHISETANVKTDMFMGYKLLKKTYTKLTQVQSRKRTGSFPELHYHIRSFSLWLRHTHNYCDKENLQGYLEEYHYRYNRRNNRSTIFHSVIKAMMKNPELMPKALA